jgi:hypothetical protein
MSKAETVALDALRSVVKLMWPRVDPTAEMAAEAAMSGSLPTEISPHFSPSKTILTVEP